MDWIEALILGIVQGLTEFLPVSSSGHLVLGEHLLGITVSEDTTFEVMVHFATVLATITVFWREIGGLLSGALRFRMNPETQYLLRVCVSMIPILVVGLFFKDAVKGLFALEGVGFVGAMLIVTSVVLTLSHFISVRRTRGGGSVSPEEGQKNRDGMISYRNSFLVGLAQAFAVLPGISRSGSTIATGLMLGESRSTIARFSFLIVLVPIMGEALLQILGGEVSFGSDGLPLLVGFLSAYVSGLFACRVMIRIVSGGKLYYFAIYCFIVGLVAVLS